MISAAPGKAAMTALVSPLAATEAKVTLAVHSERMVMQSTAHVLRT